MKDFEIKKLFAAYKSVMAANTKSNYPKNSFSCREAKSLSHGFGEDVVDLLERSMSCGAYIPTADELPDVLATYAVRSVDYSVGYWGNKNPYGVKQLYTLLQRGWTTESMIEKAIKEWSIWATPAQLSAAIFGDCGEDALPHRESMRRCHKVHTHHRITMQS